MSVRVRLPFRSSGGYAPGTTSDDSQTLKSCQGFADVQGAHREATGRDSGGDLTPAGHLEVAHETLGRISVCQTSRAEPGAMGVHTPPQCRVAGQAVPLGVARGAALKALARCATVLQQPLWLRGMECGIETSL